MKLMLTSAGVRNNSLRDALKKLVGGKMRIAFIPTAGNIEEGDKGWLIDNFNECRELGEIDIIDISALGKEEWLDRLKWANVIFVGGGNTTYLMNEIRKSGLNKELEALLKTRVYVGISAGSIILSESIQTSPEYMFGLYDDEIENPPKGLGLIDFDVRPHLNSPHFPKVNVENLKKIFENLELDMYALDDESAVVYDEGKIEVISEGKWIKYSGKIK